MKNSYQTLRITCGSDGETLVSGSTLYSWPHRSMKYSLQNSPPSRLWWTTHWLPPGKQITPRQNHLPKRCEHSLNWRRSSTSRNTPILTASSTGMMSNPHFTFGVSMTRDRVSRCNPTVRLEYQECRLLGEKWETSNLQLGKTSARAPSALPRDKRTCLISQLLFE